MNDNRDEVNRLLDSGADPNEISGLGISPFGRNTPTALAVGFGVQGDTQVLLLLIDHGANINLAPPPDFMPSLGDLPLNLAIGVGKTTVVDFLLRHGANPNSRNSPFYRSTPLDCAIVDRDNQIPNATARWDMERFGDSSRTHRWRVYDTIIDDLLKYGASPTLAYQKGWNPLHRAAQYCDSALAEKFIALGTPLNAKDSNGETPVDIAREDSCTSVLAVFQRHKK